MPKSINQPPVFVTIVVGYIQPSIAIESGQLKIAKMKKLFMVFTDSVKSR